MRTAPDDAVGAPAGERDGRARRWRALAPVGVAAIVAWLTWPVDHGVRFPIFDTFWQVALHVAAHEGRDFGDGLAFTWGPLGFLSWPQAYFPVTAVLGTVVVAGAYLTALTLVARRLCMSLGLIAGAVATFLVAQLAYPSIGLPELLEAIFLLLCASLVLSPERELTAPLAAGLAALAAFTLLVKTSAGTVTAGLLLVTLALPLVQGGEDRRSGARIVAFGLAAYALALAAFWLAARQSLTDLPVYFGDSLQLILGYPSAVALEEPGRGSDYALALVAIVAIALLLAIEGRSLPAGRRWVLAGLFTVYLVLLFRHGFTRHDEHALFAFFAPVLVGVTVLVRPGQRALAAAAAVPLAAGCLSQRDAMELVRVSPSRAADSLEFLVSPHRRAEVRRVNRRAFRARHGVPRTALVRIGTAPLHIDLSESGVAWAYPSVNWRPLPVLQSWNAYTRPLDDKNADFLASTSAPRFILRREQTGAADRNPRFESPNTTVEVLCRYREVRTFHTWQLLERTRPRCGSPAVVGSRRSGFGVAVPVPAAGERPAIVAATFTDVDQPLTQTLFSVLLKPQVVHIGLGEGRASRLPMGSAGNLHVMRLPACLDYDPGLFDPAPYESVALARGDPDRAAHPGAEQPGSYTVTFYSLPFRC